MLAGLAVVAKSVGLAVAVLRLWEGI